MTMSRRLTQQPLLDGLTADDSTCSQQDTHASHFRLPDRDSAPQTCATSGRRLADSWTLSGRAGACLKTLLVTSRWDSIRSGTIWKASATPARRRLFRLAPSVPRIGATASGSLQQTNEWWTPTAAIAAGEFAVSEQMAERSRQSPGGNLIEQVAQRMWPTPRAGKTTDENEEAWRARQARGDVATPPLALAVKMWPRPTTQDSANNGGPSQMERNTPPLNAAVQAPEGMKLSAAWVTRLMGYPDGWLDLDGPETHGPEIGKQAARGWSLQSAIDAENCTD